MILLDSQIQLKRDLLVREARAAEELEQQVGELKQMHLLKELLDVKVRCDTVQAEYDNAQADIDFYYSFDRF